MKHKRDAKIIILKRSLTQTLSFHKSFRFIVQVILFVLYLLVGGYRSFKIYIPVQKLQRNGNRGSFDTSTHVEKS